jgi:hypothetical protein
MREALNLNMCFAILFGMEISKNALTSPHFLESLALQNQDLSKDPAVQDQSKLVGIYPFWSNALAP